jgi:molecular chaperone Hsp33
MSNIVKAVLSNQIVITAFDSRDVVNSAIQTHGLSPLSADALGRTLTAVGLIASRMKNDGDYLTATVKGDGDIGSITVCSTNRCVLKGYVNNPTMPNLYNSRGTLDVAAAVGKGTITVIKDIGLRQPYVGTCELVSGEIAEDFANYLVISEQQPCALTVGVALSNDGSCTSAGGVLVEVLPHCDEKLLYDVETILYAMDELSYQFQLNSAKGIIEKFFDSYGDALVFTDEFDGVYRCDCSIAKIESVLKSLGRDEAMDTVAELGKIEVVCHFCGKKYTYYKNDVEKLFN